MTHETRDIEQQLDALLDEADDRPADEAGGDETAAAVESTEEPSDASEIERIDRVLADGAEDSLEGQFETVDEVTDAASDEADRAARAPAGEEDEPIADDSREAAEIASQADATDGETHESAAQPPSETPGESDAADEDADASRPILDPPADAGFDAAGAPFNDPHDQPGDRETDDGADDGGSHRPGAAVRLLAGINRPVRGWSAWKRDALGFIGIELLFGAIWLFVYARFGKMAGVIAAACLAPALVLIFYRMFIAASGPAAPPASAEPDGSRPSP